MPDNILITGVPGVGKTTLLAKACSALDECHPAGFYTAEIREGRVRKGFELVDFDGRRALLSHVRIESACRVGKYGIDVAGFEDFLDSIPFFRVETDLIIIDEIGKMECFSSRFREIVQQALDSETPVIATIALRGRGMIATAKERTDVNLFRITGGNRDSILHEIIPTVKR